MHSYRKPKLPIDMRLLAMMNQMVMFTLVMVIVRSTKVRTLQWKDLLVLTSGIQMENDH